jgi:hypothetical protein
VIAAYGVIPDIASTRLSLAQGDNIVAHESRIRDAASVTNEVRALTSLAAISPKSTKSVVSTHEAKWV